MHHYSFTRFLIHTSRSLFYGFLLLSSACASATPGPTTVPIRIQYSYATQPWLAKLNDCAGRNVVAFELRAVDFQDLTTADLVIRIGQPTGLSYPAYQIGTEDLLIIVNLQNPLRDLTADQVRSLFTGRIQNWQDLNGNDSPVQVWVYPAGEDVQQIFEQSFLGGSPITSLARLANTPDEMSQAISKDIGAIGIISGRLKTADTLDIFPAATNLPVLAITHSEPQNHMAQILACLQK